MISHYYY